LIKNSQSRELTEYNLRSVLSERAVTRDKVYSILSKAIFRGDLPPGQRLVESKLAKLMKVSRTPIREAIIELVQKGLVVSSPPKGVKVAPLPTTKELNEFYDINSVLRGLATRKAVQNITYQEINQLKEIIQKSEEYLKENSLKNIAKLNVEFHLVIEKCSDSKELISLLDNVYKKTRERFSEIISQKKRQAKSIEEHKIILKALIEKKGELAEKLMREHIENGKDALLQEIELRENNQ